jgi:hypothetical protein
MIRECRIALMAGIKLQHIDVNRNQAFVAAFYYQSSFVISKCYKQLQLPLTIIAGEPLPPD